MKRLLLFVLILIFSNGFLFAQHSIEIHGDVNVDQQVTTSTSINPNTAFSVEGWIYPDDVTHNRRIMNFSGGTILINNNKLAYNGGAAQTNASTSDIPINQWTHFAITVTAGGTVNGYINGVNETTFTQGNHWHKFNWKLGGRFSNAHGLGWNGKLDEIRIWEGVLSGTDIANIYNKTFSGSCPTACLLAYFKMSDGSGASLTDDSFNGNTGTISSGITWSSDEPPVSSQAAPLCACTTPANPFFHGNGGGSTDFFATANWCPTNTYTCGTAITDNLVIGTNCTYNGCATQDFAGLRISSGKTFHINAPGQVINFKNSAFVNNGDFTLDCSNGDFQSSIGSFTNTGNFTCNGPADVSAVPTFTNSGTMTLNDTWSLSATVNNTGTIKGAGTIVANGAGSTIGGTLAPGNSVGTLNSTGNITLTGTVEIEADNRTTFDVFNSTNGATLAFSSTPIIAFTFAGTTADYMNGDQFQVFTGFGTYPAMGVFMTISNNLGLTIQYNGNGEFEILAGGLLPVVLVYFRAEDRNNSVSLNWQTASEIDNSGFCIERSIDGLKWEVLDFVKGEGTSNETHTYQYIDKHPMNGINYYRLKQVDFDGQFEYSPIVSVDRQNDQAGLRLFPNPTQQSITIQLESNYKGEAYLHIYNHFGQLLKTKFYVLAEGPFNTDIDLSDLPAGAYIINLKAGQNTWSKRLVIQ